MCSWCGDAIAADDGYRAYGPAGARAAAFCRLEHVVPWVIRGPHWSPDPRPGENAAAGDAAAPSHCSQCGAPLADLHILLVRHRGAHRIADAFCSAEHLRTWAAAGGRWRPPDGLRR
jgi:hypothetical protein